MWPDSARVRDLAPAMSRGFFLSQSRNRKPQDEAQRPRTCYGMAELRGIASQPQRS